MQATLNWFTSPNSGVSTNWVISPTEIVEVVVAEHRARHIGFQNDLALGVDRTQPLPTSHYLPGHYENLARLMRWLRDEHNIPVVHKTIVNGEGYCGHEETKQGLAAVKSDPGALLSYEKLEAVIEAQDAAANPPPPPLQGEDEMLFRVKGTLWVYASNGSRNEHIPGGQFAKAAHGEDWPGKVIEVEKDNPLLSLPTTYPHGVPKLLRS
jgi:hypothetical protein